MKRLDIPGIPERWNNDFERGRDERVQEPSAWPKKTAAIKRALATGKHDAELLVFAKCMLWYHRYQETRCSGERHSHGGFSDDTEHGRIAAFLWRYYERRLNQSEEQRAGSPEYNVWERKEYKAVKRLLKYWNKRHKHMKPNQSQLNKRILRRKARLARRKPSKRERPNGKKERR